MFDLRINAGEVGQPARLAQIISELYRDNAALASRLAKLEERFGVVTNDETGDLAGLNAGIGLKVREPNLDLHVANLETGTIAPATDYIPYSSSDDNDITRKGSVADLVSSTPPASHTHTLSEITDAGTMAAEDAADYYTKTNMQTSGQSQLHWDNLTNVPATFPPDPHTHPVSELDFSATDTLAGRSSAGAGPGEEIACTAFGRSLIDDADASAGRTTLGLGAAAVLDENGVADGARANRVIYRATDVNLESVATETPQVMVTHDGSTTYIPTAFTMIATDIGTVGIDPVIRVEVQTDLGATVVQIVRSQVLRQAADGIVWRFPLTGKIAYPHATDYTISWILETQATASPGNFLVTVELEGHIA